MAIEDAGRAVGSAARSVSTAARRSKVPEKVGNAAGAATRGWTRLTGRDGKQDAKYLGIGAAAVTGVLVATGVMSATKTLVTTGVVVGAGAAGAAIYCKRNGHEQEYEQMRSSARKASGAAARGAQSFVRGVQAGVSGANAPGGLHG